MLRLRRLGFVPPLHQGALRKWMICTVAGGFLGLCYIIDVVPLAEHAWEAGTFSPPHNDSATFRQGCTQLAFHVVMTLVGSVMGLREAKLRFNLTSKLVLVTWACLLGFNLYAASTRLHAPYNTLSPWLQTLIDVFGYSALFLLWTTTPSLYLIYTCGVFHLAFMVMLLIFTICHPTVEAPWIGYLQLGIEELLLFEFILLIREILKRGRRVSVLPEDDDAAARLNGTKSEPEETSLPHSMRTVEL